MKKRHLLKTMLLLFALIVGVGSSWAADVTVTLTQSSLGLTGSYTTNTEKTIDGITYVYTDLMKNNDNIQAKASTGTIYNKTAFPGDITSVAITHSGTARATTIFGSSDGTNWTQVTTGSGSITGDFSNKGYKYFKITRGSNAAYWTEIKITYTEGGSNLSPNNLALTGAPVALSFDLYNNSSAQTISYTTSSTGAVTVSENAYVTTSVNATTQTITVTPKNAVTPETQTIIVSQAADETYAAGSVTFTVTIEDTTPFNGVIFDAAQDKGTSPIEKDNVSLACTNGALDNGSEYRLYKNSKTTISTTDHSIITKIEFIGTSSNPASGFASQDGWTTNGNNGTWTGNAESVSFTASGAQVRATVIKVTVEANTNPAITAENVDIAYDATGGNIAFTVNNGVEGGSISASTQDNWVTLGNQTTSPISFTCDANTVATERTATVTLTYTYNTNEEVTKDVTVTQAGNPNIVPTIAEVRDQGTGSVKTKGVVTSCVGTTGYIQDETAAICVYGASLTVGDEITVEGTLSTYKGLLEITSPTVTVLSYGNTVTPEVMTIADINASTNQGWLVKIENATVTAKDDQNTTIAQGDNTILVHGISGVEYEVGDMLTLTGNIGCYTNVQIANPTDIVVTQNTTPSITVAETTINVPSTDDDGTIGITYKNLNITGKSDFDIQFYGAEGNELSQDSEPTWIEVEVAEDQGAYVVSYVVEENTVSEPRSAYFKVYALDAELNEVYSDLITITQAAYVAPFESATYTLASSITSGKHYIIVGEKDVTQAMGAQNDNNRAAVDVTISDGVATVESADVFEFVIYGPDADGYYTIFDAKNDGYLYAASTSKNYLKTEEEINDNARWKIEFGEEGVASIIAEKSGNRNVMQYNPGSNLFSCYASDSQNSVYLYEKDDEAAPTESVTVSSVSYATYSSENALNFSNTGITVYTAKANGTSVKLTEVSDGIVPAYTGVVLYANGGASATVPVAISTSGTTWTDNEMVANVKRAKVYLTAGDKTNYILSNETDGVGFYKAAANGAYLPANRAYLSTTATATGNAPFLGFDGNETTGINSVERGALSVEGCYTLDGRRVAQPTKGLYIVNGRKVIIK